MTLNKWFEKGLDTDDYMETLDKHRDKFMNIYEQFEVDDESFIKEIQSLNLRVIVLAEPWCGHCMLNIPILLKLAEQAQMPVKFLLRDENLTLMDQYLTNGKSRTIPIMIFINDAGEEVAKWGPMAETTKEFVAPLKATLPEKDSDTYDEKFQMMIRHTSEAFGESEALWNGVYYSMKEVLQSI